MSDHVKNEGLNNLLKQNATAAAAAAGKSAK